MNVLLFVFLIFGIVYVIGITLLLRATLGPETNKVKRLKVVMCMGFVVCVLFILFLIAAAILL